MGKSIYNQVEGLVKWLLPFYLLVFLPINVAAQTDRQLIRQGNKHFRAGRYAESEVLYRKACEINQNNTQAIYNLGNALMAQKKDSAAIVQFQKAARMETNPQRKYQAFHNIGVICQTHQMLKEAIDAYKEALRINPHDDETRYNLELCKRQQKNQPQNNNNDKKDDKQDKKNDQQQQQQKKEEEKKQDKNEQEQPNPQISKDNAEQLLNAALQQERQTQKRMQEQQRRNSRRRLKKNW